jgi:predicted nucleic acid-binding protein
MKYVIDASVGFMWEVAEPLSGKARQLRDDAGRGVHQLLAPDLFPTEVANALLIAERRKRILPGQALLFLAGVLNAAPALYSATPDLLPRALAIAASSVASAYDCLYIALAEREQCECVTADDRLVKNLKPQFPFLVSLSSLP